MGKQSNGSPGHNPAASASSRPTILFLRKTREQAVIEGLDARGWSDDDYAVVDGTTKVGRIYREMIHGQPKWRWFLQTVPATPPNQGMADTLEEAKTEFNQRYLEVKGTK